MPFIWSTSPQFPTSEIPDPISSDAISYKVDLVANTVNEGGTLLYNTAAGLYDVVYPKPIVAINASTFATLNVGFANLTFANIGNLNASFANITSATFFSLNVASANISILYNPTMVNSVVSADPITSNGIASKQYVDASFASLGGVGGSIPIGMIGYFSTPVAPNNWISTGPRNVSRNTYGNLFSTIGTSYGSGDGTNTFSLPIIYSPLESMRGDRESVLPRNLQGHNLTKLPDGRLLLNNGHNTTISYTSNVYIGTQFGDSVKWIEVGDHPAGKHYLSSATLLPDGRVLTIGGYNPDTSTVKNSVHFATITGDTVSWAAGTNLPEGKFGHNTVLLSTGRIIVLFGALSSQSTNWYFGDISGTTITWSLANNVGGGLHVPSAGTGLGVSVLNDDRILVTGGGWIGVDTQVKFGTPSLPNVITWTSGTSSLPTARQFHSQSLIASNKILLTGGQTGVNPSTDTTTIGTFSGSNTITFVTSDTLFFGRRTHAIETLSDGRIIMTGGFSTTTNSDRISFIRIINDVLTESPLRLYHHSMETLTDNIAFVMGGFSSTSARNNTYFGFVGSNSISWIKGTNLPFTSRYGSSTCILQDGRVLHVGGADSAGTLSSNTILGNCNTVSFTTNWVTSNNLPVARQYGSLHVVPDGRVLYMGGYNGTDSTSNCYYGTVTGNVVTWTQTTNLPTARYNQKVVNLLDGRFFVCAGTASGGIFVPDCHIGTALGDIIDWVKATDLPFPTSAHAAFGLPDGRVVVLGGAGSGGFGVSGTKVSCYIGTISQYSPHDIVWKEVSPLPFSRFGLVAKPISNSRFLVHGGWEGDANSEVIFGQMHKPAIKI